MSDLKTPTTVPPTAVATGQAPRRGAPRWLYGRDASTVYALLIIVVLASIFVQYFANVTTVGFLLIDAIPILLMAMPMALIIITGEIDLSVASTAGLSAALMGVLWHDQHWSMPAIIVTCAIVGIVCGAVNGVLITVVGLPSLAVTIGTLALFRGLALVTIGDEAVSDFPVSLTNFAISNLPVIGVPTVMLIVIVVIAFFAVLVHFTPFGRALFALGYSTEAASFVGIRVNRTKFFLFVTSGFISALTGVFWALRYTTAQSDSVQGLELSVVAAVLLGGVSIFGGSGGIVGVVAGVLIIRTVSYALSLGGFTDTQLTIVTGGLLILSVVAPSVTARARQAATVRRNRSAVRGAPAS